MVLKGNGDENVVLCSDERTYTVKTADTSNSLFLIPPPEASAVEDAPIAAAASSSSGGVNSALLDFTRRREVAAVVSSYLELAQTPPRLDRLRELLAECPYAGPDAEAVATGRTVGRWGS